MTSAQHRRRPPHRGPLVLEIRTLLAAAGLPEANNSDRYRAHGVVVTDLGESVRVEWFVSRSLRRTAADEQMRGLPIATADRAHESARRHLHAALFGILSEVGYLVETHPSDALGALSVRVGRVSTPTTLVADLKRMLAELRDHWEETEDSSQ
ncbi:hypothetical protein AB0B92_10410 [Streptomyces hygroscopicus]|uniref:hypothetical protein n=1 Tax=Streptomyces hygroscopicus TaxID=1912 RepID=UPI0033E186C1